MPICYLEGSHMSSLNVRFAFSAMLIAVFFITPLAGMNAPESRIVRSSESGALASRDVYMGTGTERLGSSMAIGDFNNDSYDDLLVGAPYNDACGNKSGRAYIYFGGPSGLSATPDVVLPQNTTPRGEELLGTSVAAGDVDGDGIDDAILGAPMYRNEYGMLVGRICIFKGSTAMDGRWDRTIDGPMSFFGVEHFGCSLACGDVNGDGRDDILVGADFHMGGLGAAYLYLGKATLAAISDTADKRFDGLAASQAELGSALAVGNMNNDQYEDIALGAPGQSSDSGRVYVYLGAATVQNTTYLEFTSMNSGERFGESLAFGNFNGDNFDDLLVGAPENSMVGTNTGRAYIYNGGTHPDTSIDLQLTTNVAGERFGSAVASGDFNDDGMDDAIVGAENNSDPLAHSGLAYCFMGGVAMDSVADHTLEPTSYSEWFGCAVAAGDFWNASSDAPVVGALAASSDAGKFYVYDKPWIAPLPSPVSQDTNLNITIDLSPNEHSLRYSTSPQSLRWWVTSYDNAAIASISGEGSLDDVLTFQPVTDFQGHTFVDLMLNDTDGRNATCTLHLYWGGTNVAPTLVDMKLDYVFLNRTWTQGIYVNATDVGVGADNESALICSLKYRRQGDAFWTGYGDMGYNATTGRFEARITTDVDTPCGFYDLNITLRDTMYASSSYEFTNAYEVRNNLPYIFPSPPSSLSGQLGEAIYLDLSSYEHDVESAPYELNWHVDAYNTSIITEIYGQNTTDDNLTFVPNATFSGIVYLTLNLTDNDGGYALWQIALSWFTPYGPSVAGLSAMQATIERTASVKLIANGLHDIENESELNPEFEIMPPGGMWTPAEGAVYEQGLGWVLNITTNATTELGVYGARVRFADTNGNLSSWYENLTLFEVVNRAPLITLFTASTSSALRGTSVNIRLECSDERDNASNMYCQVRYRYNGESSWSNLPMMIDTSSSSAWSADLTIPKASPLGAMQFEALVTDSNNANSSWHAMEGTLVVANNLPKIKPISDPAAVEQGASVSISLIGKGEDLETDLASLTWYVSSYNSSAISSVLGQNTTMITIVPCASFAGTTTIELTLEDKDGGKATCIVNLTFTSTVGPSYKGGLADVLPDEGTWEAELSLYFSLPEGAKPHYSCSNSLITIEGSKASYVHMKGQPTKLENITFTVLDENTDLSATSEKITITLDINEEPVEEPLSMTMCFTIAFAVIAIIVVIALVAAALPLKKPDEEDGESLVKMNVDDSMKSEVKWDEDKPKEACKPGEKIEEFKQNLSAKGADTEAKAGDTEAKGKK